MTSSRSSDCALKEKKLSFANFPKRIILFATILSFSQINYGYTVSFSSNSQVAYNLSSIMNPKYNFLYSSIINAGALLGSLFAGLVLMKYFGRKVTLITSGFLFIFGWILFLVPIISKKLEILNIVILVAGRIITGIAVGINSSCIQVYLNEILYCQIRNFFSPLPTIFLSIGILICNLIGYASLKIDFEYNNFENGSTPVSLYLPIIIGFILGLLQLVAGFYLPESPVYANRSKKNQDCKEKVNNILKKLYGINDMYDKFFSMKKAIISNDIEQKHFCIPNKYDEYFFRTLAISVTVMSLQNFYGSYAMLYNATQIFTIGSGSSVLDGSLGSVAIGAVISVFIIPSIFVSKIFGRKILLYSSAFLQSLPLIGIGVYFYLNVNMLWLIILLIIIYFIIYNLSWAYLPWVLMAEIYEGPKKEILIAIVAQSNWLTNLIITAAYEPLTKVLTLAGTFWLFAVVCILTALFCVFFVPETKDKKPEELYDKLMLEHKYIFL